jgi:hypothetical protein
MTRTYDRDELVARLVRAGELEVSGEHPDEVRDYFASGFEFHGPGGFESDYEGLQNYFAALRSAFEDHLRLRRPGSHHRGVRPYR